MRTGRLPLSGRVVGTCGDLAFTLRPAAGAADALDAIACRLPLAGEVRHAKWSGEAFWLPLDEPVLGLGHGNATSYPAPGDVLLYGGDGPGVPELLFAYGAAHFRGKTGSMHAVHVFSVEGGVDVLAEIGRLTDWNGARPFRLERARS